MKSKYKCFTKSFLLICLAIFSAQILLISCPDGLLENSEPTPPPAISLSTPDVAFSNVETEGTLEFAWDVANFPASATIKYEVYLGTTNPPNIQIAKELTATTFSYEYKASENRDFAHNSTYYWMVKATYTDSTATKQTIESDVRSFNTVDGPVITLSAPTTAVTIKVDGSLDFIWTTADFPSTASASLSYDLYFDTAYPPTTKIAENLAAKNFTYTQSLEYRTTYYWMIKATYTDGTSKTASSVPVALQTEAGFATHVYISQSRESSPIAGATVEMQNAEGTVITPHASSDASIGKFVFYTDQSYTKQYTVKASKDGLASSTAVFASPSSTTFTDPLVVSMLLFPPVYSSRDVTTPPSITVTGITDNQSISSASQITILSTVETKTNLLTASGNRNILSLSIGNAGNSNYTVPTTDYDKLLTSSATKKHYTTQLNPTLLFNGTQLLEFVAYDNNSNQSILIIPVIADFSASQTSRLPVPAASLYSQVQIVANTYGKDTSIYTISDDASVGVNIFLYTGGGYIIKPEVLLVYRSTGGEEPKYIGSSAEIYNSSYGDEYLVYVDRLPSLSDDAIYTYQLKSYFYNSDLNRLDYSGLSRKFQVPIFSKHELTLLTPTNNKTYDGVPSTLDFSWKADYSKSIFNLLNSSYLSRKDEIIIREVVSSASISTIQLTPNINLSDSTNGVYSHSLSTQNLSTKLQGKQVYWTVASTLNYEENKLSTNYYMINSRSYPTITGDLIGLISHAQNGMFFMTFK